MSAMMLSFLLLFVAFSCVIGEEKKFFGPEFWEGFHDLSFQCFGDFEKINFAEFFEKSKKEQMNIFCPLLSDYFDCLDGKMENEIGSSMDEMIPILEDKYEREGIKVVANLRNAITDVCTNGTQLNKAVKEDMECFDSLNDGEIFYTCQDKEGVLYDEIPLFLPDTLEEDEATQPERDCMKDLFLAACWSSAIYRECGQRAFNTFNTFLKRTTIYHHSCSKELYSLDIEEVKTTLVNTLNMTETEKNLFKMFTDLRRKRK